MVLDRPTVYNILFISAYAQRILESIPEDVSEIKIAGDILYSYYRTHPEIEYESNPVISYDTLQGYMIETNKILYMTDNELTENQIIQKQHTIFFNKYFKHFWVMNSGLSLPGAITIDLSRFTKLEVFNIYQLYCNAINKIPASVKFLTCKSCNIVKLSKMPKVLEILNCSENRIKSLPQLNHTKLQSLFCSENRLKIIPKLPYTVEWIYCYNNNISTIKPDLPESLEFLSCSNNNLSSIPPLPDKVIGLYIDNNKLHSLPSLPNTLIDLFFANNLIKKMPILPNRLRRISCNKNPLREYHPFPPSIRYANIDGTLMEI